MPVVELYDHQSVLPLDMDRLARATAAALPRVLEQPGPYDAPLAELESVEVSFISDEAIASAHARFMNDDAPTDVITFQHGEILISTETALRQAGEHGHDPLRECALYVIHGLLHLNGHEDQDEAEAAVMAEIQGRILDEVWPAA
jgi:probable rRNA maturation factor